MDELYTAMIYKKQIFRFKFDLKHEYFNEITGEKHLFLFLYLLLINNDDVYNNDSSFLLLDETQD